MPLNLKMSPIIFNASIIVIKYKITMQKLSFLETQLNRNMFGGTILFNKSRKLKSYNDYQTLECPETCI